MQKELRQKLHQAFLASFTYEDLRQLWLFRLNERLEEITGPGNQRKVVFDLLE